MQILVPEATSANWHDELSAFVTQRTLPPFDPIVLKFIDAVSRAVLMDASSRTMPELMVVAHWMRMAHLLEIKRHYLSRSEGQLRLARGVVVHFAPANVDSIFLYTWFLSLLVGNSNIVRISSRRGPQIARLLAAINQVICDPQFAILKSRNLVLSYGHDESLTAEICSHCNVRVIWGGDRTVADLRQIALPPLATELAFADRFSMAVLKTQTVLELSGEGLSGLVRRFFNDAFWFDQLACSSPRLVVWIGTSEDVAAAQERFWPALKLYIAERGVSYPAVVGMSRMTAVYTCVAAGEVDHVVGHASDFPARAGLNGGAGRFRECHSGGGLFFEAGFTSLEAVLEILSSKDQTLCYFGFNREELERLAEHLPARCIDRIVPVGRALEFSYIWDGVDLLKAFSRVVDILDPGPMDYTLPAAGSEERA